MRDQNEETETMTAIEYGLIAALIAIAGITGISATAKTSEAPAAESRCAD